MQHGTFFLVVGPSGAGKDTLLQAARERLDGDSLFYFPERLITRPTDAGGEDHVPVTDDQFEEMRANGQLLLHWQAHGLCYGIPAAAGDALGHGRNVVVNVSRSVLTEARRRYHPVRILAIQVPPDILKARLLARGREGAADVERRLQRAAAFDVTGDDVTLIQNEGSLETTVGRFLAALTL